MNSSPDAAAKAIVSLSRFRGKLGDFEVPQLFIDEAEADIAARPAARLAAHERAEPVDQLAYIIYTSGTTGKPKGVMLTHANIASNITALIEAFPLDPEGERSLAFLPWAHCYGQVVELYLALATLAGPEPRSLLVETVTAGKQRTAIRIGPAGFAEGLREIAAACPK